MTDKDPEKRDNYILKLGGKAELPEKLDIGHNYQIVLQGSITSLTENDNNDGSSTIYYKFMPVHIDIVTSKGETLKLKDARSKSQLFRARAWSAWKDSPDNLTFEQYYDELMGNLIQCAPEVISMYGPHRR